MHNTIITIETDTPGEMLHRISDVFLCFDIKRIIIREFNIEISTNDTKISVLRYLVNYTPDKKDLNAKIYIKNTYVISLQGIKLTVENMLHVKINDKFRFRRIVEARQISHYLARKYTSESLKKIGFFLGGVDHATVLHSMKTIDNLLFTNKEFRTKLINIEKNLI